MKRKAYIDLSENEHKLLIIVLKTRKDWVHNVSSLLEIDPKSVYNKAWGVTKFRHEELNLILDKLGITYEQLEMEASNEFWEVIFNED